MRGSRVAVRTPAGRARAEPAPPRPLQRLQRARGARRRAAARDPARAGRRRAGPMEAVFGRVETIEVDGKPVSILLIKNPAGANEVLRTLLLEAAERDGGAASTSGSRSTTGSPTAATSPGSGTPTSSCSPARPPRRLRRHPGRRDGGAAQVRGHAARGDRGRGGDRPLAGPRRRRAPTAGSSRCPPTRRCSSCARLLAEARPGAGAGTGREPRRPCLARGRVRRLRGRPRRSGSELAGRGRRPRARAGLRHRPGRPAPGAARQRVWAVDADPSLLEALAARAAARAASTCARHAPTFAPWRSSREFELIARADAAPPDAGRRGRAARSPAAGGRPPRARGPARGRDRRAPAASTTAPAAALPDVRERRRLGLLEPAGRASPRRRRHRDPPAAPGRLARRLAERGGARGSARRPGRRRSSRPRRRPCGLRPAGRLEIPPGRRPCRLDRRRPGRAVMELRARSRSTPSR